MARYVLMVKKSSVQVGYGILQRCDFMSYSEVMMSRDRWSLVDPAWKIIIRDRDDFRFGDGSLYDDNPQPSRGQRYA